MGCFWWRRCGWVGGGGGLQGGSGAGARGCWMRAGPLLNRLKAVLRTGSDLGGEAV